MYVCLFVYTCVCICMLRNDESRLRDKTVAYGRVVYVCMFVCMRASVYMCSLCMCVYAGVCIRVCVSVSVCVYMYMFAHLFVCMYVCV